MEHPTLLRRPNADPILSRVEEILHGQPSDYAVTQVGDACAVKHIRTGKVVYAGIGPVEVVRSRAPF